jgi:hypothetical protein
MVRDAMCEGGNMKRLADSPFLVNTSWKVLFGCATALLVLIEGSGIYDLVFNSTDRIKTITNMVYVLMPWIASLLGLTSLRKIIELKNLENSTFWWPRFCFVFLVFFTYVLVIEGTGTLADWMR